MDDFRFEQLDIWKEAIEISDTIFDYANILYIFERRKIIDASERKSIYSKLISLSKKITNFRKSFNKN